MEKERDFRRHNGQIGRLFICPACKMPMSPPVRQCLVGHLICRRCFFKRRRCLVCKGVLDSERNVTIDILASIVRFPCMHSDYGCKESPMAYEQRIRHELYCPCRPFMCFVSGCKWIEGARSKRPSTVSALSEHLHLSHAECLPLLQGSHLAVKLNPSKDMLAFKEEETVAKLLTRNYVLVQGEEHFLAKIHLRKYLTEGLLMVTVMGMWRPTKGKPDHYYSVHVRGSECEMLQKAPVFSYMLSWEKSDHVLQALKSSDCIVNASKYASEGGDILLDFRVMTN